MLPEELVAILFEFLFLSVRHALRFAAINKEWNEAALEEHKRAVALCHPWWLKHPRLIPWDVRVRPQFLVDRRPLYGCTCT